MDESHDGLTFATTLRVRDACLCLHVQRAARALARHFDEALRPVGLTHGQFSLMMSLNRPEPPLMRDVAALLAMDPTTLTASLKPLVRRMFVDVAVDREDRRGRRLALTEAGRTCLAGALPIWEREHRTIENWVESKDCDRLRADLKSVSRARPATTGHKKRASAAPDA